MSSALRSRWWVIAAVVALAAVAVWLLTNRLREEDLPTAVVGRGRLEQSLETTGVVEPAEPVTIAGRVPGRIAIVAIRAGDRIDAGDIVAQLDRAPFVSAVAAATRSLEAA